MDLVRQAGADDLVFCLLSGGGSALWPAPSGGISLAEKQRVTALLIDCGARIDEINVIRKHLSDIKGGQLARLAAPARLVTLILSDVVGDRLDAIASGQRAGPDHLQGLPGHSRALRLARPGAGKHPRSSAARPDWARGRNTEIRRSRVRAGADSGRRQQPTCPACRP